MCIRDSSCNQDLTYADGGHDHLIKMGNEELRTRVGELMMSHWPSIRALDSEKHFCGIACVYRWIVKNFPGVKE